MNKLLIHPVFRYITAVILLLLSYQTYAHTGVGATHGFLAGISHPLSGLDHLLAMIAVGLWAAQLGGRAIWWVPCAFVGTMILGGILAFAIDVVPSNAIEMGITFSVLLFGLLVAARVKLSLTVSCFTVGIFALFHGYAHGVEMPQDAGGLSYSLGFALVTACLHLVGIGVGLLLSRAETHLFTRSSQFVGGIIAVAGGALFIL